MRQWEGGLINRIAERSKQPAPEVGLGATEIMYSDRHPYTIIEILSPKRIILQADEAIRTDRNGISESQTYEYRPNPDGEKVTVTLRKNGRWVKVGEEMEGTAFCLGLREEYRDPTL